MNLQGLFEGKCHLTFKYDQAPREHASMIISLRLLNQSWPLYRILVYLSRPSWDCTEISNWSRTHMLLYNDNDPLFANCAMLLQRNSFIVAFNIAYAQFCKCDTRGRFYIRVTWSVTRVEIAFRNKNICK